MTDEWYGILLVWCMVILSSESQTWDIICLFSVYQESSYICPFVWDSTFSLYNITFLDISLFAVACCSSIIFEVFQRMIQTLPPTNWVWLLAILAAGFWNLLSSVEFFYSCLFTNTLCRRFTTIYLEIFFRSAYFCYNGFLIVRQPFMLQLTHTVFLLQPEIRFYQRISETLCVPNSYHLLHSDINFAFLNSLILYSHLGYFSFQCGFNTFWVDIRQTNKRSGLHLLYILHFFLRFWLLRHLCMFW